MKGVFYISIILNIVFLFLGSYIFINRHFNKPEIIDSKQVLYDIRTGEFEDYKKDTSDIIFLGNSITEYCEWSELFNNPHIKNRGIRYDDSKGVFNRSLSIASGHPSKIFIAIGTNDIGQKILFDSTIYYYQKIINLFKSVSPSTIVYIESVLPRYDNFNTQVPLLNEKIKQLALSNNLKYIDLYSNFNQSYISADHLHINAKGYRNIKEILSPLIR